MTMKIKIEKSITQKKKKKKNRFFVKKPTRPDLTRPISLPAPTELQEQFNQEMNQLKKETQNQLGQKKPLQTTKHQSPINTAQYFESISNAVADVDEDKEDFRVLKNRNQIRQAGMPANDPDQIFDNIVSGMEDSKDFFVVCPKHPSPSYQRPLKRNLINQKKNSSSHRDG